MTDRAKLIDRILAMREANGRTDAEAEAFVSKAMALMAGHQITEAELRTGQRREVGKETRRYFFGNACQGVFGLFGAVGPVFDCAAIGWVGEALKTDEWPSRWARCTQVTVFGTEADRSMLFAFVEGVLLPQMVLALGRNRPRSRASFATAWAFEVAHRVETERRRVFDEAGVALIPFSEPQAMADEEADGPPLKLGGTDRASAVAGFRAGQTADIGNPGLAGDERPQVPTAPKQLGAGDGEGSEPGREEPLGGPWDHGRDRGSGRVHRLVREPERGRAPKRQDRVSGGRVLGPAPGAVPPL